MFSTLSIVINQKKNILAKEVFIFSLARKENFLNGKKFKKEMISSFVGGMHPEMMKELRVNYFSENIQEILGEDKKTFQKWVEGKPIVAECFGEVVILPKMEEVTCPLSFFWCLKYEGITFKEKASLEVKKVNSEIPTEITTKTSSFKLPAWNWKTLKTWTLMPSF